jgi:hypothetical protein
MAHKSVIDEAYEVFRPYRLGDDFENCCLYIPPKIAARLTKSPLKSLSLEDFGAYPQKAMTTWGTDRHFRYFLPRLVELLHDDTYNDAWHYEVFLSKLAYAQWWDWSSIEKHCIQTAVRTIWSQILFRAPAYACDGLCDSILCGIGRAQMPLADFLDDWSNASHLEATQHLAIFVELNVAPIRDHGRLYNSFWEIDSASSQGVMAWLVSPGIAERLLKQIDLLTLEQQLAAHQLAEMATP